MFYFGRVEEVKVGVEGEVAVVAINTENEMNFEIVAGAEISFDTPETTELKIVLPTKFVMLYDGKTVSNSDMVETIKAKLKSAAWKNRIYMLQRRLN